MYMYIYVYVCMSLSDHISVYLFACLECQIVSYIEPDTNENWKI